MKVNLPNQYFHSNSNNKTNWDDENEYCEKQWFHEREIEVRKDSPITQGFNKLVE